MKLVIILLFTTYVSLFSQSGKNVDKWVEEFKVSGTNERKVVLEKIISSLLEADTAYSKSKLESLERIIAHEGGKDNVEIYVDILIYMAYNGPINKKISILKRAYSKAKEYELNSYLGRIKSTLSDLYREQLQYDSAMVALLEAENYCRLDNNLNEQVAILHRLGDFYYYANLLDKAEECYKKVLRLKGEPIAWKSFRYVVVTNNLGLIEKRRKNFEKQKQYFETTLNYVLSYNGGKINKQDTLRLAYIYAKLAGAYYQLGNITQAVSYYGKSLFFTNKSNYKENLIDLMLLKSKILLSGGKYDSSLVYLDGAE